MNSKIQKYYKKLISFIISLCLLMGLVPFMTVPASAFAGGTGTEVNPFRINTLAQLNTFRTNVSGGTNYQGQHIRLDANITLTGTGNWSPIGSFANPFQGTFNGNGHIISGINFNSGGTTTGFFNSLGGSGTIRNLGIINATITSNTMAGGIVGNNSGVVENCFVIGSITSTNNNSTEGVGGIAGRNNGIIRNCFTDVSVTSGVNAGGIVGLNNNGGVVNSSYALGTVRANTNFAGGIVGNTQSGSALSHCVALQTSIISAGANAGRITGLGSGTLTANRARDSGMILRINTNTNRNPVNSEVNVDGANVTLGTTANSTVFSFWGASTWRIPSGNLNMNNLPVLSVFPLLTVTYNGNENTGGSVPIDSGVYVGGLTVTVLDAGTLIKAGHTFNGWNTQASGSGTARAVGSTFTITANTTLFAQWEVTPPIAITATYSQNYITARWDSTGADSYLLDVSTTSDFSGGMILSGHSVTGNYHRVTGLLPETEYFYRVRAVVGGVESANSNVVNVTTASLSRTAIINDQTTDFTVDSDNLQYILDNHIVTENDITNNNSVTLTLTVKETDDSAEGAESIIELSQGRLLQFFEITVEKQINNETPVPLKELPAPVEITIDLSPELSGKTGYTVYRYHDGVQRIGMDTDADEFFTVSRGSGIDGVDQIIIHTKNFSTFAVVQNIVTIDSAHGSDDVDVQARIVDNTSRVYKIDITWGDMKFVFSPEDFAGTWNPEELEYEGAMTQGWHGFEDGNNEIIVHNHSNAGVRVSFEITNNSFEGNVDMDVLQSNDENGVLAVNMALGKVPFSGEDAPSINAFLRIEGEPSVEDIENFADIWHRVGIITVTITPDGVGLTPRRGN